MSRNKWLERERCFWPAERCRLTNLYLGIPRASFPPDGSVPPSAFLINCRTSFFAQTFSKPKDNKGTRTHWPEVIWQNSLWFIFTFVLASIVAIYKMLWKQREILFKNCSFDDFSCFFGASYFWGVNILYVEGGIEKDWSVVKVKVDGDRGGGALCHHQSLIHLYFTFFRRQGFQ